MADPRQCRICCTADADKLHAQILSSAQHTAEFLRSNLEEPMRFLEKLRFEKIGMCPIRTEPLNIIEQLNQTFTVLASLRAVEKLLIWHPEAEGFDLSLGTCPGYDIVSVKPNEVIAEVFTATHHTSNGKLRKEIMRLSLAESFSHKYVFFAAPKYPIGRNKNLETHPDVQVHVTEL